VGGLIGCRISFKGCNHEQARYAFADAMLKTKDESLPEKV